MSWFLTIIIHVQESPRHSIYSTKLMMVLYYMAKSDHEESENRNINVEITTHLTHSNFNY